MWIVKKFGIGQIVGWAPGSPCTRAAALRHFKLSNTNLHYSVSTRMVFCSGCTENIVVPDIEIQDSNWACKENDEKEKIILKVIQK